MRSSLPLTPSICRQSVERLFAAALSLLAACGSEAASEAPPTASATGAATWVTHRDADGAFEARFPAPPTLQELKPPRKSPDEMQLTVTNAQHAEEARLLVATKIVMSDVGKYDCIEGLKGMLESSLNGMGCTADKNEPREVEGLPGREVEFTCQKRPMRGMMRVGCDARKLAEHSVTAFSMMAAYKVEIWNPEEATTFLDGFKLSPVP